MTDLKNKSIQDAARIHLDYNNMLAGAVGERGITSDEINAMRERAGAAFDGVNAKRDILKWRELYKTQLKYVDKINETAAEIRESFENFVVLGIGGSALGPIALQHALNHPHYNELPKEKRRGPKIYIEDNIDPERMAALAEIVDFDKTVFNVITKSGSTSETMAQLLFVTRILLDKFGENGLKSRLIATTDKDKGNLIIIAKRYGLKTFIVPDGVGGRFSELCPVGLLAAAVGGADIKMLLSGAEYMDRLCDNRELSENPALMSAVLEVAAMEKHSANISVLMPYADSLKYIADWYAQLWAESLGKKKTAENEEIRIGQTPVKALGVTDQHSQVQLYTDGPFDKTITFIGVENFRKTVEIPYAFDSMPNVSFLSGHTFNELMDTERKATEHAVTVSGHMNKTLLLPEVNEFTLGQLIMLLELQTAFAGELLGVDAFNQPGVEQGKNAAYALLGKAGYDEKLKEFKASVKKLPEYII